jgi:hypothetical protein
VIQELIFDGVAVEPGDGAQPPGDCGPCTAPGLQLTSEGLDISAADGEQVQGAGAAPDGELAQVECVRLAGQAAVSGQVPGEREPFGVGEGGLDRGECGGWAAVVIGYLPAGLEPGRLGQFRPQRLSENHRRPSSLVTLCHQEASARAVRPSREMLHTAEYGRFNCRRLRDAGERRLSTSARWGAYCGGLSVVRNLPG